MAARAPLERTTAVTDRSIASRAINRRPRWPLAPVISTRSDIGVHSRHALAGEPIIDVIDRRLRAFILPWLTWANALSALRLVITLPCAFAIARSQWSCAATLFVIAVFSDVFDGIVARRRDEATALGGLFDHSVDALFVTATLTA